MDLCDTSMKSAQCLFRISDLASTNHPKSRAKDTPIYFFGLIKLSMIE